MLWRALRSRHQLRPLCDRTAGIDDREVLAVSVMRNEIVRLPFFLSHYRRLGVTRFLIVDNDSDDGTREYLADQPDVALWTTPHSYRDARFGLDWLTWLQMKYAHGRWCLMVDADEILIYAGHDTCPLPELTRRLGACGRVAFGALILDLFPKGPVADQTYRAGQDPCEVLNWFDIGPYRASRQAPLGNLWVQGGARERVFFGAEPQRSPTLNKLPLMRWNRRFACVNSCHSMLPPRLNGAYDGPGGQAPSGVLLHSKFLPDAVDRARIEKARGQHFHDPRRFETYYDRLAANPVLWHADARRYGGWQQLQALGLLSSAGC